MGTQRIDYYDSPEAPRANNLVPAVNVVVVNHAGAILLIRRADNGNWALPGGGIDLGESVAQAAVRETFEESGIECGITGIVGIYSDPKHVTFYTSNGEARAAQSRPSQTASDKTCVHGVQTAVRGHRLARIATQNPERRHTACSAVSRVLAHAFQPAVPAGRRGRTKSRCGPISQPLCDIVQPPCRAVEEHPP